MDAHQANSIKSRTPLRASQALRAALAKRGKGFGTLTYFFSAKNDRDIVFPSDLEYARGVLLEADESVKAFDSDPDRVVALVEREGYIGTKPDVVISLWSGRTRYEEAKYLDDQGEPGAILQAEGQKRAAEAVGAEWGWFSEKDVQEKERLLHDWLHIIPVLGQCRIDVKSRWDYLADWVLSATRKATTLYELRRRAEDPWELIFATTFRLVQMGRLHTDLEGKPLSPDTLVALRGRRNG